MNKGLHVQSPKFKVEFLEDAAEFLNNLEQKVRDKIIYNITKASYSKDNELFKKLIRHPRVTWIKLNAQEKNILNLKII